MGWKSQGCYHFVRGALAYAQVEHRACALARKLNVAQPRSRADVVGLGLRVHFRRKAGLFSRVMQLTEHRRSHRGTLRNFVYNHEHNAAGRRCSARRLIHGRYVDGLAVPVGVSVGHYVFHSQERHSIVEFNLQVLVIRRSNSHTTIFFYNRIEKIPKVHGIQRSIVTSVCQVYQILPGSTPPHRTIKLLKDFLVTRSSRVASSVLSIAQLYEAGRACDRVF
mmetsp:Transcript_48748/g.110639  ORF Transcript_48748/g.110639 Transcript_48748/m.110639 type:complete len:222 (+) Transcript_48748:745-1410(+)